jgi:hypothetical protein
MSQMIPVPTAGADRPSAKESPDRTDPARADPARADSAQLWERFAALPPGPKTVQRLKSQVWLSINKTGFLECMALGGVRTPEGRAWTGPVLNEALARGVSDQYLDGSTPSAERERRVAAFQAGEADLFLISLRAGGTGLNLTAADTVVHLDPWWNPAVEDQASDCVHRIGQTRPVTIYRLIMQDSIEERIVALHRDKRSLATDLLDGTDTAGRLTEQQLLELIGV